MFTLPYVSIFGSFFGIHSGNLLKLHVPRIHRGGYSGCCRYVHCCPHDFRLCALSRRHNLKHSRDWLRACTHWVIYMFNMCWTPFAYSSFWCVHLSSPMQESYSEDERIDPHRLEGLKLSKIQKSKAHNFQSFNLLGTLQ